MSPRDNPSPVAKDLYRVMSDAALAFAAKWGAINDEGQIKCIQCNYRPGSLPSLCCAACLEHRRAGG